MASQIDVLPAVQAKANEAIARYVGLWSVTQQEALKQDYGFATYCFVQEAYSLAVNYPVDWKTETYEQAITSSQARVQRAYPFLNENSLRILSSCFAYSWK